MLTEPSQLDAHAALNRIIGALHGEGRLRVWSIIITAFGDVAPPGHDFPASALQALMARLDIGPGAVRTALSRLGKDGWIERIRNGRNISYRLTDGALPEFKLASSRIYGASRPTTEGTPRLVIVPEGSEMQSDPGLIPLRRGVFLQIGKTGAKRRAQAIDLTLNPGVKLPEWAVRAVPPPGLEMAMGLLVDTFSPLNAALVQGQSVEPLTAAAARTALIHAWRRIALRHPLVPDMFLPGDWPEASCRRFVMELHERLSPGVQAWRDSASDPIMLQKLS